MLGCLVMLTGTPRWANGDETSKPAGVANGTIEGTISYKVDAKRPWRYGRYYVRAKTAELAGTLVNLESPKLRKTAPSKAPATVVVDQHDLQFSPETVAIRAGDSIRFTNSDAGTHNVSTSSDLHPFNVTIANSEETVETFTKAGGSRRPIILGCIFHSQMRAWIFVFDHPHFQITGNDGKFRLENVPPGEYRLELIHPPGDLRGTRRVDIKPGETLRVDIALSPDDLATKP